MQPGCLKTAERLRGSNPSGRIFSSCQDERMESLRSDSPASPDVARTPNERLTRRKSAVTVSGVGGMKRPGSGTRNISGTLQVQYRHQILNNQIKTLLKNPLDDIAQVTPEKQNEFFCVRY